jgi:molybdopterin-containing oxidoreductase family membrane subunit
MLLAFGAYGAYETLVHGLSRTAMTDSVPWGLWITIDLSSIALGAGAFTISGFVYLLALKEYYSIIRMAVFIGFIGYSTAMLTLIMDIGRPDRFWHPWVYWNPHSVLWEITWCITLYSTILALEFAPVVGESRFLRPWPNIAKLLHKIHVFAPIMAVAGLMLSLLHQSSLGATYGIVKARPIWFKPTMPVLFIMSAVAAGPMLTVSACLMLEVVKGKRVVSHAILQRIARFSGYALLAYLYLRLWDLAAVAYYGRTAAQDEALHMIQQATPYNFTFWVVEIGLGTVIPAILFLSHKFRKHPALLWLGGILAAFGIVMNRWNVTLSGLFVPLDYSPGILYRPDQGRYFPNLVEWAVAAGVLGYALLAFTLGARYLPLFGKTYTPTGEPVTEKDQKTDTATSPAHA